MKREKRRLRPRSSPENPPLRFHLLQETREQMSKKNEAESVLVSMPGDGVPKFVAIQCPGDGVPKPAILEKVLVTAQKAPTLISV
ncbi:hypothetical protein ACOSQ3_017067 [Xanthoceras sorbifolium]